MPSLVEISSLVLEKKILKFCSKTGIFTIFLLSPLGKGGGGCTLQFPTPDDALYQDW